jgi:hypothetical protein
MRASLIQRIFFVAMALFGGSAVALAAPYDMPGLSENGPAAAAQPSPDGQAGYPGYPPEGDGGQCDEGLFDRLFDRSGGPLWTFTGDALALQRSSKGNQPLATSIADSSQVALASSDLDVPVAMGFETTAVRHGAFGTDFDIEVGYFQNDWALNTGLTGEYGLVTDVNGPDFYVSNPAIRYTAGLHLGEVNLRHEWCDGVTLLAGFRMGELDEHYHVDAAGAVVPGTSVMGDTESYNHLYGFQTGADIDLFEECGPLHLHILTKAGVYGNAAEQRNSQADSSSGMFQTLSASKNQTTLISELGLALTYEVNCHLTFRMTGTATWLDCVALAPDQIGVTDFSANTATVDTHGQIFYYGGGLGLDLKF